MSKKVESKLKQEPVEVKADPKIEQKVEQKAKVSKEEQPLGHTTRAFRQ